MPQSHINRLLDGVAGRESSAYIEMLISLVADYYDGPTIPPEFHSRMIQTSLAIGMMRNNGADKEWMEMRDKKTWWEKLTMSKIPPSWFVEDFLIREREKAIRDFEEAKEKDESS